MIQPPAEAGKVGKKHAKPQYRRWFNAPRIQLRALQPVTPGLPFHPVCPVAIRNGSSNTGSHPGPLWSATGGRHSWPLAKASQGTKASLIQAANMSAARCMSIRPRASVREFSARLPTSFIRSARNTRTCIFTQSDSAGPNASQPEHPLEKTVKVTKSPERSGPACLRPCNCRMSFGPLLDDRCGEARTAVSSANRKLRPLVDKGLLLHARTFYEPTHVPHSLAGLICRGRAILRSAAPECQSKSPDRMM